MYNVYVIKNGDTLEKIASEHDTTIDILQNLNNNLYNSRVGTHLFVPNKNNVPYITYDVKKGETLYEIANKFNIKYKNLLLLNGIKEGEYIYPHQNIFIPNENIDLYLVKQNDTLDEITKKINTNQNDILKLNSKIFLLPEQILFYKKDR